MGDKLLELFPAEAPLFSFLTFAVFITCISEMLSKEVRTQLIYQWHQVLWNPKHYRMATARKSASLLCARDNSFSESFLLFAWVVSSTPTHP